MNVRSAILGTCAMVIAPTAGYAQDASPGNDDTAGGQLTEIVVTAQKRAENLQDVPITVTAVGGDLLKAVSANAAVDLGNLVSGLVINRAAGSATPHLRGLGQPSGAVGIEPTVALYLDGIYFPSSGSLTLSLRNVEQVAVLKGPQGTLFGRNSTGGVIQVTTRTPGDTPEFDAEVGYGNYRTVQGNFYAAVPISNAVRTSLAVGVLDQGEGWGRNVTLNKDAFKQRTFTVQSKSVVDLGEDTKLTANLLYLFSRDALGSAYAVYPGSLGSDGQTRYISEYVIAAGRDATRSAKHYIGSLTLDHDFGWSALKIQAATQKFGDAIDLVQNGLPTVPQAVFIPLETNARTQSAEVQLQSPNGSKIRWIVGAYLLHDRSNADLGIVTGTTPRYTLASEQISNSIAAFGEISAEILPATKLTLGGRYTRDKKTLEATQTSPTGAVLATYAGLSALPANAAAGWTPRQIVKRPTWRVSLDHQATDDIMLFASYNRGFKSGIYNLFGLQAPAGPERVDAFELGVKTLLFDKRVRLNISGFYNKLDKLQLRVASASTAIALLNAAKATTKGIDVDFQAKVSSRLTFNGGFEILDAKFTRFPGAPCTRPTTNAAGVPTGGATTFICDLTGARMPRAPKFSGNVGFLYTVPLNGGDQIEIAANEYYNSGFGWEPDGRLHQSAYHSISGSIKYSFDDDRYSARVWVANLADEKIRSLGGAASNDVYSPGAPRTFGITFGMQLGR